jgi:hypothetical protein
VTVTVWPATVSVPVRVDEPPLAATSYETVPLPDPLDPDVIVIHDALLVAVQLQPAAVVTSTLALPPLGGMLWEVGDAPKTQGAASVMVIVWPATVSVPVLAVPVFAATV